MRLKPGTAARRTESTRETLHSPTPEETRKVLEEYRVGVVARFEAKPDPEGSSQHLHHPWESINNVHETVFQLERCAFFSGYYKASGFNALPCTF